jgi:KUP system potassium uptake protein
MDYYFILKKFSLSEERGFGLDVSFVTVERVPLMISDQDTSELTRLS